MSGSTEGHLSPENMSSLNNAQYSPLVQEAMEQLFPSDDPLFRADFDVTEHVNGMFPTEQSLTGLDEAISQSSQQSIQELFTRVREIKAKTVVSESMVKEITHDMKQLDVAKRNLTNAMGTLHHLHVLLTESKNYSEMAKHLPPMLDVLVLFQPYMNIEQIKDLATQTDRLKGQIMQQIQEDLKTTVQAGVRGSAENCRHMCTLIDVLGPQIKLDTCQWYASLQLEEYNVLFEDSEDCAWLDKIETRYRWAVSKLRDLEEGFACSAFPQDWHIARRVAYTWCTKTSDMLYRVMQRRRSEMSAKLLAHAVHLTAKFEALMLKRFPVVEGIEAPSGGNSAAQTKLNLPLTASFNGIIRRVFEPHMTVFVTQQDSNLNEFMEQASAAFKSGSEKPKYESTAPAIPLPSSGRLFMFYKRVIIEAHELSFDPPKLLVQLMPIFRKHLRMYADRCLLGAMPNIGAATGAGANAVAQQSGASGLNALGLASAFATGVGGNTTSLLQSLLRDASAESTGAVRLSRDDQFLVCSILATADWCAETTGQLHDKLKEKVPPDMHQQVELSSEQDHFYTVASSSLILLSQDLEAACDAALQAMTKINWSSKETVGDESNYVRSMTQQLKAHVPQLRDHLFERRKYFGHLCLKFAQQFCTKFLSHLFRCKPVSVHGAEQLLLDTYALKTFLLSMPCVGSAVAPKPPVAYTKVVEKAMIKAEMVLKLVMAPPDPPEAFIDQYLKLLPNSDASELGKVLEMKAVRRAEQAPLIDLYRRKTKAYAENSSSGGSANLEVQVSMKREISAPILALANGDNSASDGDSRIKKLERLVKNQR